MRGLFVNGRGVRAGEVLMCTTTRRMRRATPEGTRQKMALRRVMHGVRELTQRLAQAKSPDEVEGLASKLVNLRSVERALR